MSSFRLDSAGLNEALAGKDGAVFFHVNRLATRVRDTARGLCPVDQGKLRGSIEKEILVEGGKPVAVVGSNVNYAIYVHEGTGLYSKRNPRLIKPKKNGGALRWPTKNQSGVGRRRYRGGQTGSFTYSKWSRGTKGRPFLTDALRKITGQS